MCADTLVNSRVYAPDSLFFLPGIQSGINHKWRESEALVLAFPKPQHVLQKQYRLQYIYAVFSAIIWKVPRTKLDFRLTVWPFQTVL